MWDVTNVADSRPTRLEVHCFNGMYAVQIYTVTVCSSTQANYSYVNSNMPSFIRIAFLQSSHLAMFRNQLFKVLDITTTSSCKTSTCTPQSSKRQRVTAWTHQTILIWWVDIHNLNISQRLTEAVLVQESANIKSWHTDERLHTSLSLCYFLLMDAKFSRGHSQV